jgi:hypothetical protein
MVSLCPSDSTGGCEIGETLGRGDAEGLFVGGINHNGLLPSPNRATTLGEGDGAGGSSSPRTATPSNPWSSGHIVCIATEKISERKWAVASLGEPPKEALDKQIANAKTIKNIRILLTFGTKTFELI